jgi:hypothetical protein
MTEIVRSSGMQRLKTTCSAVRTSRIVDARGAFATSLVGALFWLASCGRVGVELLPLTDAAVTVPNPSTDSGVEPDGALACASTCSNEHGAAECVAGQCLPRCEVGYADCDGNVRNGCETPTTSDLLRCGGCNLQCTNASGSTACIEGVCAPICEPGRSDDCDGDPRNGCETDLSTDTRSCGACGVACANENGTTSCVAGRCTPTCALGYSDCDDLPANGCETSLATNPNHCGGCGTACDSSFQICAERSCQISMCMPGRGDCDQNRSDCETDLTRTVSSCGFCGNRCMTPNGAPSCTAGACSISSCNAGYANCDSNVANGCEVTLATNVSHCGSCGSPCSNAHGGTSCAGGSCAPTCSSGWASCDGNQRNGCETALTSVTNCGMCGNVCPNSMANATPVCNAGICGYSCASLAGVYALRLRMPVSWPSRSFVASGSGIAERWLRVTLSQSGTTVSGSLSVCGATMPEFRNSILSDRYLYRFADAAFDAAIPSVPFSATLGSMAPGASLSSAGSAILMGIDMSDAANGAWPSQTQARASQADHDADGEVGVTIAWLNDSTYSYVQTSGTLGAARAAIGYTTERLRFSLGGALTGCAGASGPAVVQSLDTRVIGCRLSGGSYCSSSQYDHLDSNAPVYGVSGATYSMTRVANVGATVSCAQVRAAL